jgi:hypothetical protein
MAVTVHDLCTSSDGSPRNGDRINSVAANTAYTFGTGSGMGGPTSCTFSITSGSNLALVVLIASSVKTNTTTVTINGTSVPAITGASGNTTGTVGRVQAYGLVNPPTGNVGTGANPLVITTGAAIDDLQIFPFTVIGANQTGGATTFANGSLNTGTATTATTSAITNSSGDLVVGVICDDATSAGFTIAGGATLLWSDATGSSENCIGGQKAGTGAGLTISATMTSSPFAAAGFDITQAAGAAPFSQKDWPTLAQRDSYSYADKRTWIWYSHRLLTLPNPKPIKQTEWPNPRDYQRLPDYSWLWYSERLVNLPNPKPSLQSYWPNPQPIVWYKDWNQNLVQFESQTNPKPFNQSDWPNPRAYPLGASYIYFSEQLVNLPNPKPFKQYDYPNPYPIIWYQNWIEAGNTQLPFPTIVPFIPQSYPNPINIPWYRDWNQNLVLTTLAVTGIPFVQSNWPLSKTYTPIDQTYYQSLVNTTLSLILVPFSNEWSTVPSPINPVQTWTQNLLETTLAVTGTPFAQYDWPNPRGYPLPPPQNYIRVIGVQGAQPFSQSDWPLPKSVYWDRFQSLNLLETTLSIPGVPFVQLDWKNPYPLYWYRDHNQNLVILIPPGIKPFSQSDWPVPRGQIPIDQYWYQSLAALFPPPQPVPPPTTAGRSYTESELREYWTKRFVEHTKQQHLVVPPTVSAHFARLSPLGHAARWNAKPASKK